MPINCPIAGVADAIPKGYGHPAKEDDSVNINSHRAYAFSKIAIEQELISYG